jgi:hypothetical protein
MTHAVIPSLTQQEGEKRYAFFFFSFFGVDVCSAAMTS